MKCYACGKLVSADREHMLDERLMHVKRAISPVIVRHRTADLSILPAKSATSVAKLDISRVIAP